MRTERPDTHCTQRKAVRWLIEELGVSLFAQVLGTWASISEKRIRTAIDNLLDH